MVDAILARSMRSPLEESKLADQLFVVRLKRSRFEGRKCLKRQLAVNSDFS
jgi:hypothetical protein